MKWIAAALVLANLGLLMWGLWFHQPLVAPAQTPPAAVNADQMKLLAEPGARLVVRSRNVRATETPPADGPRCYRLGPFATLEKARAAGTKLEAWGLSYERLAEFETLGLAYRVMFPPLPSREAAERKRRELAALGFTDSAPIQQEEGMENAISLGIFAVEQNARTRLQELSRKGVQATIQPIPNVRPVYSLALAEASSDGLLAGVPLDRFGTEDWGAADVALRPATCRSESAATR